MDVSALFIPAFIAGLATFLAPCTFPLIPAYIGLISGVSAGDLAGGKKNTDMRRRIIINGVLFVLGFSSIFIILGAGFGLVGTVVVGFRYWITKFAGIFLFVAGLSMLGVIKFPGFNLLRLNNIQRMNPAVRSFVLGIALGAGWTPCVGPILGAVFTLAFAGATVLAGAQLLAVFSFGLAVPFLLVAFFFASVERHISRLSRAASILSFVSGITLIFFGYLIFFNKLGYLMGFAFRLFPYQDILLPLL